MLFIEKNENDRLNQKDNFTTSFFPGELISGIEFKRLQQKFELRMYQHRHNDERVPLYFTRESFDRVIAVNPDKVAFVFLIKNLGDPISVAMLGMDASENLMYAHAYESSATQPAITTGISERILLDSMRRYEQRMKNDKLDYYPCRDKGVLHDLEPFKRWLETVTNVARVFFGVENNDLQNVMLVGDKGPLAVQPDPDDMYAFDKTGGCCS
jgi:hypothetical protein